MRPRTPPLSAERRAPPPRRPRAEPRCLRPRTTTARRRVPVHARRLLQEPAGDRWIVKTDDGRGGASVATVDGAFLDPFAVLADVDPRTWFACSSGCRAHRGACRVHDSEPSSSWSASVCLDRSAETLRLESNLVRRGGHDRLTSNRDQCPLDSSIGRPILSVRRVSHMRCRTTPRQGEHGRHNDIEQTFESGGRLSTVRPSGRSLRLLPEGGGVRARAPRRVGGGDGDAGRGAHRSGRALRRRPASPPANERGSGRSSAPRSRSGRRP